MATRETWADPIPEKEKIKKKICLPRITVWNNISRHSLHFWGVLCKRAALVSKPSLMPPPFFFFLTYELPTNRPGEEKARRRGESRELMKPPSAKCARPLGEQ